MSDAIPIVDVIGSIYEASYQPENWPAALQSITTLTDSNSSAILLQDFEIERASVSHVYNISRETVHLHSQLEGGDPNFRIFAEHLPIGTAAAADHIIDDRKKLEEIYGPEFNKYILQADLFYIGGAVLFSDSKVSAAIAIQRRREQGVWRRDQIDLLTQLVPHLQRALNIHKEFIRLQTKELALRCGLDRLIMGVILFNKDCKPVYINPVAESILQYHPAIKIENEQIRLSDYRDTQKIYTAIRKASEGDSRDTEDLSTAFGISHPSTSTVLPVLISPVHGIFKGISIDNYFSSAVMCFSDPERSLPIEQDKLAQAYNLTPAEAKVVVSISNGMTPQDIADLHNVAVSTIRSQIKAIYTKLGINHNAELIKLVLTGPFSVGTR